jgi:dipeptidyl aminopeptidase/acylaminoacyl peptidase
VKNRAILIIGGASLLLLLVILLVARLTSGPRIDSLPDREIVFATLANESDVVLGFINPDGTGLITISLLPYSYFQEPTWSLDGEYLVMRRNANFGPMSGTPMLISSDGEVLECRNVWGWGRAWGVGEDRVVTIDSDAQEVILLDMNTCQRLDVLYQSSSQLTDVAVSTQGWLAVVGDGLHIITPSGEEVFRSPVGHISPAWSPDGELLALSYDAAIYVVTKYGSDERLIVSPGSAPSWSPDGRWLVFAHGTIISKVNVDTGETVVLYENGGGMPAWRWGGGE